MTCSEFIQRFSEYYDGAGDPSFRDDAEAHLASCGRCRRYLRVVDRGLDLLRSFPGVRVSGSFHPRLKHRIYHVEDEASLSGDPSVTSATTAATTLGIALLLVMAAWSPTLWSSHPEVVLSPIVVTRPASSPAGSAVPATSLLPLSGVGSLPDEAVDPWSRSNSLLFRYSPLFEGSRARPLLRRTGLD